MKEIVFFLTGAILIRVEIELLQGFGLPQFFRRACVSPSENRNLALHSGSLVASIQKVHRPRSESPVHFEIMNM